MDKNWMNLSDKCDSRFAEGITAFINFVKQHKPQKTTHKCPCRRCRLHHAMLSLDEIQTHLFRYGIMQDYTTSTCHGEVDADASSSLYTQRQQYVMEKSCGTVEASGAYYMDPTAMKVKVNNGWSDKSFNDHLRITQDLVPSLNNYPSSYSEVKRLLKNMGMGYEIIHACEYGCVLFYKEYKDFEHCPVCDESRYLDGDAWQEFDHKKHPDFARDTRNVRLGLSTDGFNPFGEVALSHSTWPIVVMPYNLPPSMCMKKEFNILALLISGPKSPSKCLNVFMQALIDELNILWDTRVLTYDRHERSTFNMKIAVIWTISDFLGLGMLGSLKAKGYKACPLCLYDIDAKHFAGRMSYQGHHRWLDTGHSWRHQPTKFNGDVELQNALPSLTGEEILSSVLSHEYPVLSLHPDFKSRGVNKEKLCWTHMSIFYDLPYWSTLKQHYSLDVMHIEKNVFDNIIDTILGFQGKTKEDIKAREGLEQLGISQYKRSVQNNRYQEGCIAEQYITHECVMYCKLYMNDSNEVDISNKARLYVLNVYSPLIKCYVNSVKFVVWDRERKKWTQNFGLMVEDALLSATTARQVFYLDDLKAGDIWKVVNVVSHRGLFSDSSLAREDENEMCSTFLPVEEDDPYQEQMSTDIAPQHYSIEEHIDLEIPRASRQLYLDEETDMCEEDDDDDGTCDEDDEMLFEEEDDDVVQMDDSMQDNYAMEDTTDDERHNR
ncbi:hypothetical protein QQ045_011127 [Rhodiola kirilowii]